MTQPTETDRRHRRSANLAGVLLAASVALGCGSDDATDASTDSTTGLDGAATTTTASNDPGSAEEASDDVCDIVSDDVAAEVLGVEIVRREAHGELGSGSVSCIKGTAKPTAAVSDLSGMSIVSVARVAGAAALVDEAGAENGSQAVTGLGDRAWFLPTAGVLYVAIGADEMQVQVVKAGVPGSQQDCVAIAMDMLERRS